jgi:molybdenum cofactor synthesis domain-containing protein
MTHYNFALIIIGNEILSGRTQDTNTSWLARCLSHYGQSLKQVSIIEDDEAAIVDTVNRTRARFDRVITSGGLGPTHDDITADSLAKAFQRSIAVDPRADSLLRDYYASHDRPYTEARRRMARIPQGADLIHNPLTAAPGFRLDNVFALAGVPSIFQAMAEEVLNTHLKLPRQSDLIQGSLLLHSGESAFAEDMRQLQNDNPHILIGSYPRMTDKGFEVEIVLRGSDRAAIVSVLDQLQAIARAKTVSFDPPLVTGAVS